MSARRHRSRLGCLLVVAAGGYCLLGCAPREDTLGSTGPGSVQETAGHAPPSDAEVSGAAANGTATAGRAGAVVSSAGTGGARMIGALSGPAGPSGSAGSAAAGARAAGASGDAGANPSSSAGDGGRGGSGPTAGASGSADAGKGSASQDCPYTGHINYTIAKAQNPSATELAAYDKIKAGMDKALGYYNCYTDISKSISVSYVPSVQTADGNINGSLRFGSDTTYMDYRTCMHEISHTVGIGQASNWSSFMTDGLFTGSHANAQLKTIDAKLAMPGDGKLHADAQHFWPYGINQQSEVKSEADLIAHCQMVVAIRMDLGLK